MPEEKKEITLEELLARTNPFLTADENDGKQFGPKEWMEQEGLIDLEGLYRDIAVEKFGEAFLRALKDPRSLIPMIQAMLLSGFESGWEGRKIVEAEGLTVVPRSEPGKSAFGVQVMEVDEGTAALLLSLLGVDVSSMDMS